MHRLLLFLLLAFPAWAQETDEPDPDTTGDRAAESADSVEESADEDVDSDDILDELYSDEDEEAFIPSENVKFGQSIPFPTDI